MSVWAASWQLPWVRIVVQVSLADTEVLGGVKRTIESALLPQEADLAIRVASDEADNYCFFLTALETVNTSKLDAREFFFQGGKQRKLVDAYPVSDRPA